MLQRSRIDSRSNNNNSLAKSTHIVEGNLQKQDQLLQRYRNSTQNYIDKMESKTQRQRNNEEQATERKNARRERLQSHRRDSIPFDGASSTENVHDYQKLIMGLEYALELERKKREMLQNKSQSLETQVTNLRNLLGTSSKENSYERLAFKEYQDKINALEAKVIEQKQNYEFIIDSKNEGLASLEFQLRTLEKKIKEEEKESATSRKFIELMAEIEQLRSTVIKKNITIERMRFHQINDSESEQEDIKKLSIGKKMEYYLEQLQISNKLILRKNIQILNSNKKILKYEEVLDVIEHYLDKKQVKNVDLNILEHACVNKLRLLLREKSVFQRELLNQLNQQNKRIASFQKDLVQRDSANGGKVLQLINDNKRLAGLANTLQNTIKNLERDLEEKSRNEQIMQNQLQINKKQFTDEILRLKDEINTLSSVTKIEFDRMKLENNKLLDQNRSLVALLGDKDRQVPKNEIQKKASDQHKQKNPNTIFNGDEIPQIGNKLVLINTFTQWVAQWARVKKWQNKKVLLNIILDKTQIRADSLKDMGSLINALHDAFLNSRNIEVEQRAIILLSHYLQHNILDNVNLYLDKISPYLVKGLRPIIQNEQPQIHRILNESSLKILSSMQKRKLRWEAAMTHQMISCNGMKTLFHIITNSQIQEMITNSYNCLIMIAKANEMIPIMNSFSISALLLKNLNNSYQFIIHLLQLLKELLRNREFVKALKSIAEFKQLFKILKEEQEEECADLILDCLLLLLENTSFVQSINKLESISILGQAIRNHSQFQVLKKIGSVYQILIPELEHDQISKMPKEISKLVDILKTKKFTEHRFNRAIRIMLQITSVLNDSNQLDEEIMKGVTPLYEYYDQLDPKGKVKLNAIVNTIFQRNKNAVNRYSNDKWIIQLVEAYKSCLASEELIFLLKILLFQHQQKRSTQIIRSGRDGLISKHISDSLNPDYVIALPALKNLLSISKQKYAQKFIHQSDYERLVDQVLLSRSEQQFLSTTISILYYFCKNEEASGMVIEMGIVPKMLKIMKEKHDNDGLMYKCLTLMELCHTTNYKRRILNYLLSDDHNLQILKTLNFILKKAKNKQEMGSRAVFIYDFLNGKSAVDSFAILAEQNIWMVDDLVDLRNQYVSKVDDLVYKVELLLHNISNLNPKVRKAYEKFRVEGNEGSDEES